jgi:hypothetical protein
MWVLPRHPPPHRQALCEAFPRPSLNPLLAALNPLTGAAVAAVLDPPSGATLLDAMNANNTDLVAILGSTYLSALAASTADTPQDMSAVDVSSAVLNASWVPNAAFNATAANLSAVDLGPVAVGLAANNATYGGTPFAQLSYMAMTGPPTVPDANFDTIYTAFITIFQARRGGGACTRRAMRGAGCRTAPP